MELTKWKNGNMPSFSGLLDEFFTKELNPVPVGGRSMTKTSPAVNIRETVDKFILEVAVPGLTKEDFSIEVTPENRLVISSEHKESHEKENGEGHFTLKEFSYNAFSRSFSLPNSVDPEQIDAVYKDGLLEIILPKKPEALPKPGRMIAIK